MRVSIFGKKYNAVANFVVFIAELFVFRKYIALSPSFTYKTSVELA